jgi:hypothetical protein
MSCPNDDHDEIRFRVPRTADDPPVEAGETARIQEERGIEPPPHDCWDHPVPYTSDGALGHGWECGVCGEFLQAG